MLIDILGRLTPEWVRRRLPESIKKRARDLVNAPRSPSFASLQELMTSHYQVRNLVGTDAASFRKRIDEFLQLRDHLMEGFQDPSKQRDLSIQFLWGHNHDFGDFALEGKMHNRHLALLARYIDKFRCLPLDLTGKRVLDIGCWTGGTSLLLCAMGAEVVAIEEVRKYVDCVNYLKQAFDVRRLTVHNLSLYECTGPEFQDAFDLVLYAGVLYHVSDPVLSLRIAFNSLKDGGVCLLETAGLASLGSVCKYEGPTLFEGGSASNLSRSGWNWFIPSRKALRHMMHDAGFAAAEVGKLVGEGRLHAVGRRGTHTDITRAGLSVRGIR